MGALCMHRMTSCCSSMSDWMQRKPDINDERVDMSHFNSHRVIGKGGFGKVTILESRLSGDLFALKSMSKTWLHELPSNITSVWLERHIMIQMRSRFLVRTHFAMQDEKHVHLVMEFKPGGDLYYHLHHPDIVSHNRSTYWLPESHVRFYMAEIMMGLQAMHQVGLVYRDLKPSNVLLDADGHCALSDFGLAGDLNIEGDGKTVGSCGTNGYMSRELRDGERYDTTPDVYAFGVVMYELLHGHPPVRYEDPLLELRFDARLSAPCLSLLCALLSHTVSERLGCDSALAPGVARWRPVREHAFFVGVNWPQVVAGQYRPPFRPKAGVANCDPMYELEEQLDVSRAGTTRAVAQRVEGQRPTVDDPAELPEEDATHEQNEIFNGWEWHVAPKFHTVLSAFSHDERFDNDDWDATNPANRPFDPRRSMAHSSHDRHTSDSLDQLEHPDGEQQPKRPQRQNMDHQHQPSTQRSHVLDDIALDVADGGGEFETVELMTPKRAPNAIMINAANMNMMQMNATAMIMATTGMHDRAHHDDTSGGNTGLDGDRNDNNGIRIITTTVDNETISYNNTNDSASKVRLAQPPSSARNRQQRRSITQGGAQLSISTHDNDYDVDSTIPRTAPLAIVDHHRVDSTRARSLSSSFLPTRHQHLSPMIISPASAATPRQPCAPASSPMTSVDQYQRDEWNLQGRYDDDDADGEHAGTLLMHRTYISNDEPSTTSDMNDIVIDM